MWVRYEERLQGQANDYWSELTAETGHYSTCTNDEAWKMEHDRTSVES